MMIVSVGNQKGGVGKTTMAVNLAHYLALKGWRVLLADGDVQGHCARALGLAKGDGLFRLLIDQEPVRKVAVQARPGLDLITSDKKSERIRANLPDAGTPALYVAQVIDDAAREYDIMLLDLAPGSDVLHIGALTASNYLLVPASMEFLSLDGVVEVIGSARSLGKYSGIVPPKIAGVVPTKFERRLTDMRENLAQLCELVGAGTVLPPIPKDTHVPESTARGLTMWEYAPESGAVIGYANGSKVRNSRGLTGGLLHLGEICDTLFRE